LFVFAKPENTKSKSCEIPAKHKTPTKETDRGKGRDLEYMPGMQRSETVMLKIKKKTKFPLGNRLKGTRFVIRGDRASHNPARLHAGWVRVMGGWGD